MYALLVVEDADETALYSLIFQRAGLAVTTAKDLERAMKNWPERPADLVFISLPAPSPQEQLQRVRAETQVPLILAVNAIDENLQCSLLKMGADLIVTPLMNAKLLIAQVTALMRRSGAVPSFSLPTLEIAGLTLDPATRTVEVDGNPTQHLTHLEFRLLYALMINRGQIIPTETVVERVWGYTGQGDRDLVRGLVSRLRSKIEADPRTPHYILTAPGIGYSFRDEEK